MKVQTVADQLFFVTAYLSARAGNQSWVATGFIYAVETDKRTAHFLITNKHVFERAEEVVVRLVGRGEKGEPALGKGTQITVQDFGPEAWTGHPDPRVDVAAMSVSAVLLAMGANGRFPFFRSLSPSLCLDDAKAATLDSVEEVMFVGYPSGIFDRANLLPVIRRGPSLRQSKSIMRGCQLSSSTPPFFLDRVEAPCSCWTGAEPMSLVEAKPFSWAAASPVLEFSQLYTVGK